MMKMKNEPGEGHKWRRWLKRTAGISAWGLLASVAVMVLSGWGITQTGIIYRLSFGLIDRGMANDIHRTATVALGVFFMAHVLAVLRLKLHPRRPAIHWLVNVVFLVFAGLVLWLIIFMTFIRLGG